MVAEAGCPSAARAWSQSKSTASPPKGSESITAVSFIPRRTRQTTKKTGIVITELKPISAYLIVDGWGVVKESRAENCAERITRRELRGGARHAEEVDAEHEAHHVVVPVVAGGAW